MQDFTFHNPTKIIFGKDTIPRIGAEAREYGKKLLFVYGQSSIKKSGCLLYTSPSPRDS